MEYAEGKEDTKVEAGKKIVVKSGLPMLINWFKED
jgi:hypothetical protein